VTREQLQQEERAFVELTRALDLNWGDAERLWDLVTAGRVADVRDAAGVGAHTLTWTEDARLLEVGALGSYPKVVAMLVEYVRSGGVGNPEHGDAQPLGCVHRRAVAFKTECTR